jgi:hypothetical protein
MPFRRRSTMYRRSRSLARRQGGTGATFSGSQNIIRHSNTVTATIGSGKTQAFKPHPSGYSMCAKLEKVIPEISSVGLPPPPIILERF